MECSDLLSKIKILFSSAEDSSFVKLITSLFIIGSILVIGFIVFEILMVRAYHENEQANDEGYNPLLSASTNGLIVCVYLALLSLLVIRSVKKFQFKHACIISSISFLTCLLLDAGLLFFYPIRLNIRCSLEDFDDIIRNCRDDFSSILAVIRHGSAPIILISVGVFHSILVLYWILIPWCIFKQKKQVYEINGRGNGHARIHSLEHLIDTKSSCNLK